MYSKNTSSSKTHKNSTGINNIFRMMRKATDFLYQSAVGISNYLSLFFIMSYLPFALNLTGQAYLFAYFRYTYLYFMVLREPLFHLLKNTDISYLDQPFGILVFTFGLVKQLFARTESVLLLLLVSSYVFFNPLALLASALIPTISAFTFGLINSCIEIAIVATFVHCYYDKDTPMSSNEAVSSSLTGLLLMLWMVHDELMMFNPLLAPALSLMSLPIVQMNIVGLCGYAMVNYLTSIHQSLNSVQTEKMQTNMISSLSKNALELKAKSEPNKSKSIDNVLKALTTYIEEVTPTSSDNDLIAASTSLLNKLASPLSAK